MEDLSENHEMQEEDMYLQQSVSEPEDIENNDFSVFLSQPGQKQS